LAATEVRLPRPGSGFGTPHETVIEELWRRTGGARDKVDEGEITAMAAGVAAQVAQDSADAAQTSADAAQVDATKALADSASANKVHVDGLIENINSIGFFAADGRVNLISPYAGVITKVYIVPDSSVTAETDIDVYINGVVVTGGQVTIAAGSAQGDVTSATPTAANVLAIGDRLVFSSDGASASNSRATVMLTIDRS
jgi:hypothetical protein